MTHIFRRTIVLTLCAVVLVAALTLTATRLYGVHEQRRAFTFYTSALRDAHLSRDVLIDGTDYRVLLGVVTTTASSSIAQADMLHALHLTYEVAVAARSPQFGLAGTDPDKLEKEVTELARVQQEQADSLRIQSNIDAVRTSLYPISFLRALAAAERARLAFIASGSGTDALAYRTAIHTVIEAQRHDSALFGAAYKFLGYDNTSFPLFGGTMTSGNVEKAIAAIRSAADTNAAIAAQREKCFDGDAPACDTHDLTLVLPQPVADTHNVIAEQRATSIEAIYKEALPGENAGTPVALSSSTCVASVPGPYIFSDPVASPSGRQPIMRYLGDIFFSTSTASVAGLTKGTVHAPVDVWSPMEFYRCADKGLDVSRVSAVEQTALFAQAHPAIAGAARTKLLSTAILHEDDAVAYVLSAMQSSETYPLVERRQLTGLVLMFHDNSAGLDRVVNEVWTLGENNLKLKQQGYPFDDSLLFFFGSHSAFPTLFQAYNPSVVQNAVSIYDRSGSAFTALIDMKLRYSTRPEYRGAIVQFLRDYHSFEHSINN